MKDSGQLYAQATLTSGKELPVPIQKEAGLVPDTFSKLYSVWQSKHDSSKSKINMELI
jgi:hypothetical protein